MSIINLENSFKKAELDNIQNYYFLINIENAVFKDVDSTTSYAYPIDPYQGAIETLKKLHDREDIKIIFSSNIENYYLSKIFHFLRNHGITKYHFNKNPDIHSIGYKYYDDCNFYFNYQLDRRSGFEPETDWIKLNDELSNVKFTKTDKSVDKEFKLYLNSKVDDAYEYFDLKEEILRNTTEITILLNQIKLDTIYYLRTTKNSEEKLKKICDLFGINVAFLGLS